MVVNRACVSPSFSKMRAISSACSRKSNSSRESISIDNITSAFRIDTSLPYNHNLYESVRVENKTGLERNLALVYRDA
ncbi:hypothetical protein CSKR_112178 [Clonorchis sinensis]|uniref:Uncharacterized protein n=1 Tax=Clonorchis sinensis TaxID=79923 RepID=A0A419Q953_CLOSI|nr:hypothetical protein CSKR_112178 [Clonorchis sinensis]